MDFKKRMRQRWYLAFSYCVIGIVFIIVFWLGETENYFLNSFGFALLAIGITRIVQNRKITKSEDSMRKREILESDERNRMIAERAKSWTFTFSITTAGIIVIILSILGYHDQAQPLAWLMCLMVAIYWVFWLIAQKKY